MSPEGNITSKDNIIVLEPVRVYTGKNPAALSSAPPSQEELLHVLQPKPEKRLISFTA